MKKPEDDLQNERQLRSDVTGTIVGVQSGNVLVQLETGEHALCGGVKRLHRQLGCFSIPVGQRVEIRFSSNPKRKPLIVTLLNR